MDSDSIKWLRAGTLRLLEPVKKRLNSCWMDLWAVQHPSECLQMLKHGVLGFQANREPRQQFPSHPPFLTLTEIFPGPSSRHL
jgi:hypothetical protein